MVVPCKDCPDRKIGCHSVCDKYIAYNNYRTKILNKAYRDKKLNTALWESSRHYKNRKRK